MKILVSNNNLFLHYTKPQLGRLDMKISSNSQMEAPSACRLNKSVVPKFRIESLAQGSKTSATDRVTLSNYASTKYLIREHLGQTSQNPDWNAQADLNGDGRVNATDKLLLRKSVDELKQSLRNNLGKTEEDGEWNPDADLNGDGRVNATDKLIFLKHL